MATFEPRLYLVTGKGGVGKTTFSLALCHALKKENRQVHYSAFDQDLDEKLCQNLGITNSSLTVSDSAQIYIARKLKSETIASWIMKTPFFKSLFQMVPSLGYMIFLGHIIDLLEKNPELHIVVDCPSSGHALTMLESTSNFKRIFKSGALVEDIERMNRFLEDPKQTLVQILTLPTLMAAQEGTELADSISELISIKTSIILNNLLSKEIGHHKNLPDFLKKKISIEEEVIREFPSLKNRLPTITALTADELIRKLSPLIKELSYE